MPLPEPAEIVDTVPHPISEQSQDGQRISLPSPVSWQRKPRQSNLGVRSGIVQFKSSTPTATPSLSTSTWMFRASSTVRATGSSERWM